jgi:hypothetical protein
VVVQVKSRSGRLLGTGTRASISRRGTVTVKLKSVLKPGSYRAIAQGRDARRRNVKSKPQPFRLR